MNAVLIEWEGSPATLNFLTDITERKLAEEALQQSNQKLEAIISASPDGIGMLTLDGKMQFLSDKLLKMYDYTIEERNEIIGKPAFDFIDPSNHQTLTDNLSKLLSGESDHRIKEYVGIRKDRSRFYVDLNYALLLDSTGNPVSILFIERDSTERKRVEAEIKLKNEMLIRADEEKDKFISVIAHDLRSPFYSLLGLTEILATDSSEMTSLEITKYSKSLHESVVNLYTLLEKLLEWAQLQKDSTGFVPRALLLYDIFSESIESVNQKAMHKGITILNEIPKDQKIYADDKMISSVLRNLIFNAIKFTNKGGKIVGTSREIEDGWVEVSVTDTGIGIYKNIMAKLFKLGEKVSTRGTENEPSTGLGLLMCKDFIEKHGGKIWAESEEGKGSTFRFTLRKTGKDIK
jgi:PAS domain S-box-containing protein